MSYPLRHSSPLSLNPISRAPSFVRATKRWYRSRCTAAVSCHPFHAVSCWSQSRLLASTSSAHDRSRCSSAAHPGFSQNFAFP